MMDGDHTPASKPAASPPPPSLLRQNFLSLRSIKTHPRFVLCFWFCFLLALSVNSFICALWHPLFNLAFRSLQISNTMHIPNSLLALLALIPSIATASPTPSSEPGPSPTPDFSSCVFPAVIETSIEGSFALSAFSDTVRIQSTVLLRTSSVDGALEPYLSGLKIFPPFFTLNEGSLKMGPGFNPRPQGGFAPISGSEGLELFVFGGSGEPAEFFSIRKCDASGNPYHELKSGTRGN